MKKVIGAGIILAVVVATCGVFLWAQPASGVSPTLLIRATYDPFKVETDSLFNFEAKAKTPVDVVLRRHDYAIGGSTGWHTHPGPVLINVTVGTVTFYDADDPTCTPHPVSPGQGYVDNGHGHIGINESGAPAQDISVILAPVGQPFRTDLPAGTNPACPF